MGALIIVAMPRVLIVDDIGYSVLPLPQRSQNQDREHRCRKKDQIKAALVTKQFASGAPKKRQCAKRDTSHPKQPCPSLRKGTRSNDRGAGGKGFFQERIVNTFDILRLNSEYGRVPTEFV